MSASFFVGYFQAIGNSLQFWAMFVAFQAALLMSLISFRNVLLKQVSIAMAALIVVNLFSPLLHLVDEPVITLLPNIRQQLHFVGDVIPGFNSVQTVTTDSKGYRTNTPIDYGRKDPNTLRIVAIGGSTTEDIYLDDAKTWTSLLAAHLSKALNRPVEMINTGVSGLRAPHHLATLQDSEKYSPDIAIFMMGINDWNRQIKLSQLHGFEKIVDDLGFLSVTETVLFRAIRLASKFVGNLLKPAGASATIQVREETGASRSSQNDSLSRKDVRSFQVSEVPKDYESSVDGISAECRKRRIVCFFVDQATAYDPAIEPALKRLLWMTPPRENYTLSLNDLSQIAKFYNAWLEREAKKNGMEFCGVARAIPPTTELLFDDCHFNERGAQQVATLLAACMEAKIRSPLTRRD